MLYIVSTPIGNLKDMSFRAVETLQAVDLIAAEDTRHTKILTQHYQIKTPLTSYFEHNKIKKSAELIKLLKSGKDIALVTDAGTPGISDPGYRLINLARENHIDVCVVPGPTALIAALSASGFPSDRFIFEGFLPDKPQSRKNRLKVFQGEKRTVIFYVSPHKVSKTLQDIEEVLNDPPICVARELTKKFEEILQGKASELAEHFIKTKPRGELVLLLNNNIKAKTPSEDPPSH